MHHQCPAAVCACVQVCAYLTVSKYVYLHAWMNLPHYHIRLLYVPQAVALLTVIIQGRSVQHQFFICLSCHHTFICGDYDKQTPQMYLSNTNHLGIEGFDETSVLFCYFSNKFLQ